jgi:peptidoglycan/LPS O-acetylase OafA/YrhL
VSTAPTAATDRGDGPRRRAFRADIQGLRGLAVLAVVLYHAGFGFSGGYVGVDVFFVISGFVITQSVQRELERTGTLDLGGFYARRVRRLLPALAVVLVVVLLVDLVATSPFVVQPLSAHTGLAASLFGSNIYLLARVGSYFDVVQEANFFLHTWSLAVEEQFYLVFPLAVLVVWRSATRRGWPARRTVGILVGATLVVSFGISWALLSGLSPFAPGASARLAFFSPVTRAWELAAGALLALAGTRATRIAARCATPASVLGLVAVAFATFRFDAGTAFPGPAALVPVGGAVLLLGAGTATGGVQRLLGWRPLAWIGDVSYGWYLWHWPAIVLVGLVWPRDRGAVVVAVLGSLAAAAAMRRYVERPVQERRRWGRNALRLAAACVLVPAAAALVLARLAPTGLGLHQPASAVAVGRGQPCFDTPDRWPAGKCRFRAPGGRGTIVLVGDSQALAATDGVVAAGRSLGYDVAVWSRSGCPFLHERVPVQNPPCAAWQAAAERWVVHMRPALVVVANRSPGYTLPTAWPDDTRRIIQRADGAVARTETEAIESWSQGFAGMLRAMRATGAAVVDLEMVPEYPSDFRTTLSLLHRSPRPSVISRREVAARRDPSVRAERATLAEVPGARSFDPVPTLCAAQRCSQVRGETWLYRDANHLSAAGSALLAPSLRVTFERALADVGVGPDR